MRTLPLAIVAASLLAATGAMANHPVLVEGNCLVPPAGSSSAPGAGVCGDYDGDGRIGAAENNDGDRVFGTINFALGAGGGTGANQNGKVTIVTSGVFAEAIMITAAGGNVQIEAAPGVEAIIDAVLQGDPGSGARQSRPGVSVEAPGDRRVTLRNLVIRNWAAGLRLAGASRVAVVDCVIANNVNHGIVVSENARVKIDGSEIIATGFRVGATGDFPRTDMPSPGNGITFVGSSSGAVFRTEVSGSFRAGISDQSGGAVLLRDAYLFDNNPNLQGVAPEPN